MNLHLRIQQTIFTILLVEDEAPYLNYLSKLISAHYQHFRVLKADNGMAALEVMETQSPDLIITDWDMPHLNGLGLIEKVRDNPQTFHIPIIMVTGVQQMPEHLGEAIFTGATDFIRKPITPVELRARLHSALCQLLLKRDLAAEQQKLIQEKTEALERLNAQVMRKNRIIRQLKSQSEQLSEIVNVNLMPHLQRLIHSVNTELKTKDDVENLDYQIRRLHPELWGKLEQHEPSLTRAEKYLCVHIYHGRTSGEIAQFLSISMRSVEMARYRLRKKLALLTDMDIKTYLDQLV